ncbi:MAG: hypothetical protein P4L33_17925 [Capsulimonadaceae bacterium]|nr:hypothetical protein [Capsulimonadaceae bacterium]
MLTFSVVVKRALSADAPAAEVLQRALLSLLAAIFWACATLGGSPQAAASGASVLPGARLSRAEQVQVNAAACLLSKRYPGVLANTVAELLRTGRIRMEAAGDAYFRQAEKQGGTPFAYTLPRTDAPRRPLAIVLGHRFLAATTPAQAALLAHEAGHWRAFVKTGASDEYDGYKAEYDAARSLGLGEGDGLTYFAMLDGVVEYVVPRDPRYAARADVRSFMAATSQGGSALK